MGLRFPYRLASTGRFIPSLPGRMSRPRPVVPVTVIGRNGSVPFYGTLDTAADDTVFPETVAAQPGIDLSTAPTAAAQGVGGSAVTLRYAEVVLQMSDGRENREWPAWVAFASMPMPRALLGFAGCLQFFTATFYGDLEEVELEPNRLYPGT